MRSRRLRTPSTITSAVAERPTPLRVDLATCKHEYNDRFSHQMRSAIRFLQAGLSVAEIHRRMSQVYGKNFMSDSVVRGWQGN